MYAGVTKVFQTSSREKASRKTKQRWRVGNEKTRFKYSTSVQWDDGAIKAFWFYFGVRELLGWVSEWGYICMFLCYCVSGSEHWECTHECVCACVMSTESFHLLTVGQTHWLFLLDVWYTIGTHTHR